MRKKILILLLIIGLMLTFSATIPVFASDNELIEIDLASIIEDTYGDGYSYSGGSLTITGEGPFLITTSVSVNGRGVVVNTAGTTAAITLENVSISNTGNNACAFTLADEAKAVISLIGTNVLTSGQNRAGLEVPAGAEILITGTPADELTAIGGQSAAGIGGGNGQKGGVINISSVEITAKGGLRGAGIGSGYKNSTSDTVGVLSQSQTA